MRDEGDSAAGGARARTVLVVALMVTIAFGTAATAWGAAAAPGQCAPVTIAEENARPGGTGWVPPPPPAPAPVQGYANTTSAVCGARVTLYLGTRASRPVAVRIAAWRLGYYRGAGGRLVWTSGIVRVARPKVWKSIAPVTNMVSAPWRPSLSFTVPHSWTQGVYELRIDPLATGLRAGTIPFVVRDGAAHDQARRGALDQHLADVQHLGWLGRVLGTAHVARREPQPTVRRLRDGVPDDRRLSDRPPCRGARARYVVCDRPGSRPRC